MTRLGRVRAAAVIIGISGDPVPLDTWKMMHEEMRLTTIRVHQQYAYAAALELVMSGEISYDVECNPLHGPRVEAIIQKLESGYVPPKLTYVGETAFDTETITQEILDGRGY